jgi:bifunctional non-homologous end joining protein LigD
MYASVGSGLPGARGWTFEPKYDGVRVLAHADRRGARLVTRNGRDKARQFPEVVAALRALAARAGTPLVLDGEIVALASRGYARFQALQSRMHLGDADAVATLATDAPAALVAFDLLAEGKDALLDRPWSERRDRLERLLDGVDDPALRLGESHPEAGERLLREARRRGWEGIIAKRMDARYVPGARSRDWLKLKVEFRQELVVGGFTEPRRTRPHLGALLLGYYDEEGRLVYAGHTGGGFTHAGLAAMRRRLDRLERRTPPFADPPRPNETVHWVRPEVVVEVKFSEWTADGRLRQPIFVGVRDDKPARAVTREGASVQRGTGDRARRPAAAKGSAAKGSAAKGSAAKRSEARRSDGARAVVRRDDANRGGAPSARRAR